ncbi:hypothetical protein ODJ79_11235 [Actinoplanes sp. KI2]|uniref:hypothetical protein n=1 Tax=Actinoplanes sp. KI2 TaxID=2983315 RepID=UPI0021D58229|nr:hypothetical protein [Actinoplanes sp. KI2]MCU7724289.1 hypothetical protein [Actinoplanes sp. KI2]
MQRVMSALLVTTLCLLGVTVATPAQATPNAANLLTPYDPAHYTDLYTDSGGPITGATYIFNPTVDWQRRMAFDLAQMRQAGVNTVGLYNLVQMTDAERDTLFAELERNRMKAVIRIEWYDQQTFAFTAADAARVLSYYSSDDPAHGYTGLLPYLARRQKLADVVYLAVNMPVDDGKVSSRFVTAQYPDGRKNPRWATSQPPYADRLLAGLRAVTGCTKLYLSVFYGWDQSYPTPSYAGIAHPADGYFLNNYSYPISGTPPDENASTADRLNEPRLRSALDRMIGQYGTAPKVIEYGFHTLDFNNGVLPNQTAGLVSTVAAKRKALTETTAYYKDPAFGVRGTLYFAENLFKPEGNPPATMDWALGTPVAEAQAEDTTDVQYYAGGSPADTTTVADPTAWGGEAVTLSSPGAALVFYNLTAASVVQLRYRAAQATDLLMSMNGATPRTLHLPAATDWSTYTADLAVPLQGGVTLQRPASGAAVTIDWLGGKADNEAELAERTDATLVPASGASRGEALSMPAGRPGAFTVDPAPGGTRIQIRYAATEAATVRLTGAATATVGLPATGGAFTTVTVETTVTSGAALVVTRDSAGGDLLLDYLRIDGQYEAESSGGLYNGAHAVPKPDASEGAMATSFDVVGASVVFSGVRAGSKLTFRYRAAQAASMTVILNDVNHRIAFPGSQGSPATATMALSVPANAVVIVQRNADNAATGLSIDWMSVS